MVPPNSQEYNDALQDFLNTLKPEIIELKRVQNLNLLQQYEIMKAQMKQRVPNDCQLERQLFHGTNKDACENINHQGFNRSFAGKHGNNTYILRT